MTPKKACRIAQCLLLAVLFTAGTNHGQNIVINEILAAGAGVALPGETGDPPDWIELRNPGAAAVDLAGWSLSDNPAQPRKWVFPEIVLDPGQFLVVKADGMDAQATGSGYLSTNFALAAEGEYLGLYDGDGKMADEFAPAFPPQRYGFSWGRSLDGGSFCYFSTPTPGQNNTGVSFIGFLAPPMVAPGRGFYDAAAAVEMTSGDPDAVVRYTLDGSEPTEASPQAAGALQVSTTTILRAAAFRPGYRRSESVTHTYVFPADVIRQPMKPAGFPTDWLDFDAPYGMDSREAADPRIIPALKSLPTLSVVMDPKDLFEADGIYANSGEQGIEWERPASLELMGTDGATLFQINGGARISGGWGRDPTLDPKHAFRFYFRRDYGPPKLEYDLFGGNAMKKFDVLMAKAMYNQTWLSRRVEDQQRALYVRDAFAAEAHRAMGRTAVHFRFVHLYLNGLYWGFYQLQEQLEARFMHDYLGGDKDQWDVLKHQDLNPWTNVASYEVKDGESDAWDAAYTDATTLDLAVDANYDAVAGYINAASLIDFMLIHLWGGDTDSPVLSDGIHGNNWYAARLREDGEQFQFFLWDSEWMMLDVNSNQLAEEGVENPAVFYTNMRANPEFRLLFADRAQRHLFNGGALTADANVKRLENLCGIIDQAIIAESARWGYYRRPAQPYTRDDDWVPLRDWMLETYLPQRNAVFLEQLRAAGLFPQTAAPEIAGDGGLPVDVILTNPNAAGTVYYTLDGTDPRLRGGAVNNAASAYAGPIPVAAAAVLKARVLNGQEWSALAEINLPLPIILPELWAGSYAFDNGWVWSSWFGYFHYAPETWRFTYHVEHGWLWNAGPDADSCWFWDGQLGWFWTSQSLYPYLWRADGTHWLYYVKDSGSTYGMRWFWDYSLQSWLTFPPNY